MERTNFSLEVTKLIVSTVTAILLFVISQNINQANLHRVAQQKDIDEQRSRQDKINDKKIELWDKLGPKLNRILQYVVYIGDWKHIKATQVVKYKRESDELVYTYRPFFSSEFLRYYDNFMDTSFQTYGGMGEDARIRTSNYFRGGDDPSRFADGYDLQGTSDAYYALLSAAGKDFDLTGGTAPVLKEKLVPLQKSAPR